jgi:integrase
MNEAVVALALTTGMRPSENMALRGSDIMGRDENVSVALTPAKERSWRFAETKRLQMVGVILMRLCPRGRF